MTGENRRVTPKEVYDAYPGAEFLAVEPPRENETIPDYINRVGRKALAECGDTLFTFLIFEMAEAGNRDEAINMLERALDDMLSVLRAVENN